MAYRSPSLATWPFELLFSNWRSYSDTLQSKSPSSLAWLIAFRCAARCCLRPRGGSRHLSVACLLFRLRSGGRDRPVPKNYRSRGYVSDSAHPRFTSLHSLLCLGPYCLWPFASDRLTRPYSGGLHRSFHPFVLSLTVGIIARLTPPSGSSADAARGYRHQKGTAIRGRGSGKRFFNSAYRSQVRRVLLLRFRSHLTQALSTCLTYCWRLREFPLTP